MNVGARFLPHGLVSLRSYIDGTVFGCWSDRSAEKFNEPKNSTAIIASNDDMARFSTWLALNCIKSDRPCLAVIFCWSFRVWNISCKKAKTF